MSAAASEVEHLRDEAAALLQQAAVCSDPERRDRLTRAALALIDQARRLVAATDAPFTPSPGSSLH